MSASRTRRGGQFNIGERDDPLFLAATTAQRQRYAQFTLALVDSEGGSVVLVVG